LLLTAFVSLGCTASLIVAGSVQILFWLANALGGVAGLTGLAYDFGLGTAVDSTGRSAAWAVFFQRSG
jgi:hypothetical protein